MSGPKSNSKYFTIKIYFTVKFKKYYQKVKEALVLSKKVSR